MPRCFSTSFLPCIVPEMNSMTSTYRERRTRAYDLSVWQAGSKDLDCRTQRDYSFDEVRGRRDQWPRIDLLSSWLETQLSTSFRVRRHWQFAKFNLFSFCYENLSFLPLRIPFKYLQTLEKWYWGGFFLGHIIIISFECRIIDWNCFNYWIWIRPTKMCNYIEAFRFMLVIEF